MEKISWFWKLFWPGYLHDAVRVVYFFLFLIFTVIQTYFALQLEEQIAKDPKYPETIPGAEVYIKELNN